MQIVVENRVLKSRKLKLICTFPYTQKSTHSRSKTLIKESKLPKCQGQCRKNSSRCKNGQGFFEEEKGAHEVTARIERWGWTEFQSSQQRKQSTGGKDCYQQEENCQRCSQERLIFSICKELKSLSTPNQSSS